MAEVNRTEEGRAAEKPPELPPKKTDSLLGRMKGAVLKKLGIEGSGGAAAPTSIPKKAADSLRARGSDWHAPEVSLQPKWPAGIQREMSRLKIDDIVEYVLHRTGGKLQGRGVEGGSPEYLAAKAAIMKESEKPIEKPNRDDANYELRWMRWKIEKLAENPNREGAITEFNALMKTFFSERVSPFFGLKNPENKQALCKSVENYLRSLP